MTRLEPLEHPAAGLGKYSRPIPTLFAGWALSVILCLTPTTATGVDSVAALRSRLKCGISTADLDRLATEAGLPAIRRGGKQNEYFTSKSRTIVVFGFDDHKLRWVQEKTSYGLKGLLRPLPRTDLCTGEVTGFATVTIRAPARLLGAQI